MTISSSLIVSETAQADGTKSVHERHTDHLGQTYDIVYFAAVGSNTTTILSAHATVLDAQIKDIDLRKAVFDAAWNYVLNHATNNELAAFVRELYRNSEKEILSIIARRILEWITNGRFTETQIRNAFGLTLAQWTTLKTKMENLVTNYNAVQSATGE